MSKKSGDNTCAVVFLCLAGSTNSILWLKIKFPPKKGHSAPQNISLFCDIYGGNWQEKTMWWDLECGMRRRWAALGLLLVQQLWVRLTCVRHLPTCPSHTLHLQLSPTNNRIWLNETEDLCGKMILFGWESRLRKPWHYLHWGLAHKETVPPDGDIFVLFF